MHKLGLVKLGGSRVLGEIATSVGLVAAHDFSKNDQSDLQKLISAESIAQLSDLCGWAKVSSKAGQYGLSRSDRRKQLKKVEKAANCLLKAIASLDPGACCNLPTWINKGEGHEFGERLNADLLALVHGVRSYSEVQKELSKGRPKSSVHALDFARGVARIVAAEGIKASRAEAFLAVCTVAWRAAEITDSMDYVIRQLTTLASARKSSTSRRPRTAGASRGEKASRKGAS